MAVGEDIYTEPAALSWTDEIQSLIGLFCVFSLLIPLTTYLEENYSAFRELDLDLPHFSLLLAYIIFLSTAILFLVQLRYMNRQRQKMTNLGGYLFLLGLVGLSNSVFFEAFSVDNSQIAFLESFYDEAGFLLLAAMGGFGEISRFDELLVSWVNRNKLLILQLLLVGLAVIAFFLTRDLGITLGILMIAFLPTPIRRRQQIFDAIHSSYNWLYNRRVQIAMTLLNLFAILMFVAAVTAYLNGLEAIYPIVLLSLSLASAFIANYSSIISQTKNALQYLNEKRLEVYRTVATSIGVFFLLLALFADLSFIAWPYLLLISFFFLMSGWIDRVIAKLTQFWNAVVDKVRALFLWIQNTAKRIQTGLQRALQYCQTHWQGIARGLGTIAALGLALVGLFFYRQGPSLLGLSIMFWLSLVLLLLLYLPFLLVLAGWLGHKIAQGIERVKQALREFIAYVSANRLKTYRITCTTIAIAVVLTLLLVGPLRSLWGILFFGGLILILVAGFSDTFEDLRDQVFLIVLPLYLLSWFGLVLIAPLLDDFSNEWPVIFAFGLAILFFGWLDRIAAKLKQVWIAAVATIRTLIRGLQRILLRIHKGLQRTWHYCQVHWRGVGRTLGTIAALGLAIVSLFFVRLEPLVFGFSILFWLSLVFLLLLYLPFLLVLAGMAIQAMRQFIALINANRLKAYRITCTTLGLTVVLVLLLVGPLRSFWPLMFFGGLILVLLAAISDAFEDIRNRLFLIGLPAYLLVWFGLAFVAPFLDDFSDIWGVLFALGLLILLFGWLDRIAEAAYAFGVAFAQAIKQALIFVISNRWKILRTIGNVLAFFFVLFFIFSFLSGSTNYLLAIVALFLLSASNPEKTKQYSQSLIDLSRKTSRFLYRKRYRIAWLLGSLFGIGIFVFGILADDPVYLLIGVALFSLANVYYVPRVSRMLWNQLQIVSQWVWTNKKGILRTISTMLGLILGIWGLIDGNIIFLLAAVLLLYAAFFGSINARLAAVGQRIYQQVLAGLRALQYAFYRFVQALPLFLLLFISLGLLGLGFVSIIGWDFTGVFADSPPMVLVLVGIGYLLAGSFTGHFAIERRDKLRWNVLPIPAAPMKAPSKKKATLLDKGLAEVKPLLDKGVAEVKPLLDKGLAEVKPFLDKGLAAYKKLQEEEDDD
ncbi:MAG: hypothetical protein ACFFGZ_11350 [Candidatus Thorarchaeota archaeon]